MGPLRGPGQAGNKHNGSRKTNESGISGLDGNREAGGQGPPWLTKRAGPPLWAFSSIKKDQPRLVFCIQVTWTGTIVFVPPAGLLSPAVGMPIHGHQGGGIPTPSPFSKNANQPQKIENDQRKKTKYLSKSAGRPPCAQAGETEWWPKLH